MRRAQKALADFLRPIDWSRFTRRNLQDVVLEGDQAAVFACADGDQALLWLLRTDAIGAAGMIGHAQPPAVVRVSIPALGAARYQVTYWNTIEGRAVGEAELENGGFAALTLNPPPITADLAIAVRRLRTRI